MSPKSSCLTVRFCKVVHGTCGERQNSRSPERKAAESGLVELLSEGLALGDWQRGMLSNFSR